MLSIIQLLKWKRTNVPQWSHSALVDFQQIHVRNIFLFCFGLSMARQFFGPNIMVQVDGSRLKQELVDTKCFINGTFSEFKEGPVRQLNHDYYQWVSLVLLLLAISFHFPFRIWSKYASQFIREISNNLKTVEDCSRVVTVLRDSRGDCLFWKMFGLECAYFLHLALQIFLLDWFFNRMWSLNGWSYTTINLLFPEMATCWYDYFTEGGITEGRFRCLLPLNSVYRKVFWVIYSIFLCLIVWHMCFLLYRLVLAVCFGKEWINIWWSIQIAKSRAETWLARRTMQRAWTQKKETFSKEYASVDDLITLNSIYMKPKRREVMEDGDYMPMKNTV